MLHLKTYQQKVLNTLKEYLVSLSEFKAKYDKYLVDDPEIALEYNYPKKAWEKIHGGVYLSKQNGLKEPLPDIYLKVPTGGGKTLLACHSIDLIHKTFLKKQTGLVLWIVPSTQIYRQTLSHLRNREHHYRQTLDISSGGRTLIKEKGDLFSRADVEGNLVILLLMLPSASRQNKETLRMFRDSGGFTDFFPAEDAYETHEKLLQAIPSLDSFGEKDGVFGRLVKTSLGNTLRLLKPVIIIDEGHKAYSDTARDTIRNFNPSFLLELSATPPANTNKLVEVTGKELNEEEMIKLDIHLTNKTSLDWKNTMLASVEQRELLQKKAIQYEQSTGEYIRPICLIQVERTGSDQRDKKFIHAEDVKEFLIKKCNVPERHIAIKSSEKDELVEVADIFSKDCEIRYIITRFALQEGWDCSFAYVLTILTNPASETSITQLIGRILRQPKATKTKVKELDECYVYTYRQNAADLVRNIEAELSKEGLGDIAGRITIDSGEDDSRVLKERTTGYRESFKKFEGKIYLPKFVIQEQKTWRDVNFDIDILSRINWEQVSLKALEDVELSKIRQQEQALVIGLSDDDLQSVREKAREEKHGSLEIDESFLTRHILDIIPNPWVGFELGKKAVGMFLKRYDRDMVAANFVFIIEELKKVLESERDRLSEIVFKNLVKEKKLIFFLLTDKGEFSIPPRIRVRSNKQLIRSDNTAVQRSLFDYVPEEDLNDLEQAVAIYLDQQEKLLWWYRNMSRQHYHIQGWRRNKIYPDFIASDRNTPSKNDYGNIYVLETKGIHLAANKDTKYKQDVFALCNELGTKKAWEELDLDFPDRKFAFQVIFENEWENKINKIIEEVN